MHIQSQMLALHLQTADVSPHAHGFLLWKCDEANGVFRDDTISALLYFGVMKLRGLQDNLRRTLHERIAAGELTGLRLAEQTGFRQAHISNFLNRKRRLSMAGMDRVLSVQRLSVLDLLNPDEVSRRARVSPRTNDGFETVAVVASSLVATQRFIMNMQVMETHKFNQSFLASLRAALRGKRRDWERFVACRADADSMSMHPRLTPGALVLVDRHYNSLEPYRTGEFNIYAVEVRGKCKLRYVEVAGSNLILRPHNQTYGIEVLAIERGKQPHDYIVGRVCYVGMEI